MKGRPSAALLGALALSASCFGGGRPATAGRASATPRPAPTLPVALEPVPTVDSIRGTGLTVSPPAVPDSAPKLAGTTAAKAPERPAERCRMDLDNTPDTRTQMVRDPVSGKYYTYVGGGIIGHCVGQDITFFADSAESYDQSFLRILLGNVKYREKRIALDAQKATYFQGEERLLLEGAVHAVLPNGTVMDAPRAEYFRAVRGIRARARLLGTGRPVLRYTEKDSLGKPLPPVNMTANDITAEGDSTVVAVGKVILTRTDLVATGDSAYVDSGKQWARLMKQPVIESKGGEQSYTLRGRVLDIFGASRQVNRVVAMDSARALSKDLELVADTIDLRVIGNKLQRSFAFGPGGARATTPDRDITADSLDVLMPDQRIRELRALRKAYAESDPDTVKVLSGERDWLRGDTIVARFDSLAPDDSTTRPKMREIIAAGLASSYFQLPSNAGIKDKPGVNYLRGNTIRVAFVAGEVQTVYVQGQSAGMYLEAVTDTTTTDKGKAKRRPKRPAAQGQPIGGGRGGATRTPVRRPPGAPPTQ